MAVRKKRRKARVLLYPPNIHIVKLNVILHNQSEDTINDCVAMLQNLVVDKFPPGSEGAYEINEVQRKGKK